MNPGVILDNLAKKTRTSKDYKHQRLYRNLYNRDFYLHAYGELAKKEGNMTSGADGKTLDRFNVERIDKLITSLKDESYHPKPATRTYTSKKNGRKRSLAIPSIEDKMVQRVVTTILENIYEQIFSNNSHGFRPNRSCHTALEHAKVHFQGATWFIEGDIKGFFDNIDHAVLIHLLRKRIDDERFLRLIRKFLNAGYIEDWNFSNTYTGIPQGGIISPILANIYLHELDEFMQHYKDKFDKGDKRGRNKEYRKYAARIGRAKKKLQQSDMDDNTREQIIRQIRRDKKMLLSVPNRDPYDKTYRRLQYIRYADDFLVGIIGSKQDAEDVKQDMNAFLKDQLQLELSIEKTLVTNATKPTKFLAYELSVVRNSRITTTEKGVKKRTLNGMVMLKMPSKVVREKLLSYDAIKIINKPHEKEVWKPKHRNRLLHLDALEIFLTYNAEIRGLYNYYKLAHNVSYLHKFAHNMKYSLVNTLAAKNKMSKTEVFRKYKKDGTFGIEYSTTKGKKFLPFYDQGFTKVTKTEINKNVDIVPNTKKYADYVGVVKRLLADECEWCKATGVPLEIHHIRKVKNLKGKKRWEKVMIARNRKTMALCINCHNDLHAGKLD